MQFLRFAKMLLENMIGKREIFMSSLTVAELIVELLI